MKYKLKIVSLSAVALIFCAGLILTSACSRKDRVTEIGVEIENDDNGNGTPDTHKYSFSSSIQGWEAQTGGDSQGITGVAHATEDGSGVLACTVEMVRNDGGNFSKGEAWVDMQNEPPAGITAPVDLDGVEISARIKVGAWAVSTPSNGVQVFVKDSLWRSWYSGWRNIEGADEDEWIELTATVTDSQPAGGWMDGGFDPEDIIAVGVKIGAGTGVDDDANIDGTMYIDYFDW